MDYRSVKIPEWVYENALATRSELLRRGLDALPEEVREPQKCPRCGGKMEALADEPRFECGAGCGYSQDRVGEGEGVPLGVLFGLGLASLLERLGPRKMDPERARKLAAARKAVANIQTESVRRGLDKMTEEEIEAEIQAARRERRARRKQ
jgi:ribosomal protein S27AE